jgi:hypothetical protein
MTRNATLLHLTSLLGAAVLCLSGCAETSLLTANSPETPEYRGGEEDPFLDGNDGGNTGSNDDDECGTGDPDPPADAPQVVALEPAPDSSTHHYRRPIVVTFDQPAPGATVSLYDAAGYSLPVSNRFNEDSTQLTAEPAQWLLPNSRYTASVDVGEANLEYLFDTSEVGSALDSSADVDGATFAIDFSTAESGLSPALAALMGTLGSQAAWMWQVGFDSTSQAFSVTAGLGGYDGDGLYQDLCTPTEVLATSESPVWLHDSYFASEPGPLTITVDAIPLEFEDAWFDGDFVPDGSAIVELGFYGWLKAESVEPISGSEEGCTWLNELLALQCAPCPSDVGECVWIEVDSLDAARAPVDVTEVSDSDFDGCDDEPIELLSCSAAGRSSGSLLAVLGLLLTLRIRRR